MASITMSATTASSLFSNINISGSSRPSTSSHRGLLIVAKASNGTAKSEQVAANLSYKVDHESSKKDSTTSISTARRDLMFAAAAAAACSIAGVALADSDQPKAGSAEAKKIYAPICVSNPTARICRN